MSSVCVAGNRIAVSSGNKAYIFDGASDQPVTLALPPVRADVKENKATQPEALADETKNVILGLRFSSCGTWFSAYSAAKQLLVWRAGAEAGAEGWSLASERYMPKAATSLKFTADSRAIVIVDKAGDAVQFSLDDLAKEGDVILGHLSMLLDVVLTADGKQIITCDRDEKIRVSHYPNAYNIIAYCLGHKEFVSSLSLLPHNPSVVLSCSGDGTMKLWEFLIGKELVSYDCSADAVKELTVDPTSSLENEKTSYVIVRKVCCFKLNSCTSLACVALYGYHGFLVYQITGENFKLIQAICPSKPVLDFCFANSGELIIRLTKSESDDIIQCLSFDSKSNNFSRADGNADLTQSISYINNVLKMDSEQLVSLSNVPQLLKRKFDNVKEYYEQKKARIGEH